MSELNNPPPPNKTLEQLLIALKGSINLRGLNKDRSPAGNVKKSELVGDKTLNDFPFKFSKHDLSNKSSPKFPTLICLLHLFYS